MAGPLDGIPAPDPYPRTSRYHGIGQSVHTTADGQEIPYTPRRILPPPERLVQIDEHVVADGDRADNLANRYLGDAEQWWRIADANPVMDPADLTRTPGRVLRITLPDHTG
ncbi:tail protein X [Streptomyces paludis]|uniref:LysM domain-containing protein n=1 Tax=Streptomyces paludis TaxID=2282738 RepID=A0A345HYW7_9ACTN|nr:tail protein X [Streptomyces paludis]AXG81891.1 LysM domain-containing protein [Streptomyces paludis]